MEKRIKILFFIESLAGGGAEKILATIADHIDRQRFDVTVCSVTAGGVHAARVAGAVAYKPLIATRNRLLYKIVYNLICRVLPPGWVYRVFLPKGSDVEVAFCEGFATKVLARSPAQRKVAWVHIDLVANPWTQGVAYHSVDQERSAYSKYSAVVCVSDTVKESFERKFGLGATTLYNPVESDRIRELSTENIALPPKNRTRFVSTGRLVDQKGYDRLLKVAKKLGDGGFDFELWILGDGHLRDSLSDYIDRNGLAERVKLWGFVDNPYPYVASADAFVCSSRSEGYSTAATEAIVLGVPVVTTLCAGMRELLGDGGCGIIVENEDMALYGPLEQILREPARLGELKRMAQLRSRHFDLSSTMAPIEELLDPN